MPLHEITVERKIDTGHRVVGHRGKCQWLHGHTYTIEVKLSSKKLNDLGMVVDFGDIKAIIDRWDHKLILWKEDGILGAPGYFNEQSMGIVRVPFNPTAENIAQHLAEVMVSTFEIFDAQVSVSETESTTATHYARKEI